jgi:DNA-binding NtrC family response regulator
MMANLLIVDDELGMRQFLTHLFQREGHTVRVAESGQRALDALRQEPADLIISDIKMPDMNGIELLRAARELLPDVEVIMMTAFASVDTAREACAKAVRQRSLERDRYAGPGKSFAGKRKAVAAR